MCGITLRRQVVSVLALAKKILAMPDDGMSAVVCVGREVKGQLCVGDNYSWKQRVATVLCVIAAVAVLGIALIAMGEDIGADMTYRTFGHLVSFTIATCVARRPLTR